MVERSSLKSQAKFENLQNKREKKTGKYYGAKECVSFVSIYRLVNWGEIGVILVRCVCVCVTISE